MKKISELAQLFAEYKIYPKRCYKDCSPAKAFQKKFPGNYYSKDLKTFLSYQDYKPDRRGADLSWWGKKFFTKEKGVRIIVVSQDTAAEDASSIVLEAQFFSDQFDKDIDEIKNIKNIDKEKRNQLFKKMLGIVIDINRRKKITNQFTKWGIDLDFLYMTDASKVYREEPRKKFDKKKSRELLVKEIELCNPDLIILLGAQPLSLLDKNKKYGKYGEVVENGKLITIKGKKCVVAPCFYGQGHTQKNFKGRKGRLEIASNLIKKLIKLCKNSQR